MPVVESEYESPWWLRGGHAQTLYANMVRAVDFTYDRRTRIDTPDGDFLDLDWSTAGHDRIAVLSHGLEGRTQRNYMRGMARALRMHGWDVLAWNLRGCSGTPNRSVRTYHSGATEDLATVVNHALARRDDSAVALIGFSLGGNLTLKYLGEQGGDLDARIRGGVAFSTPIDLLACSRQLLRPTNWHYTQYFLRSLREKVAHKRKHWPERVPPMDGVRTLLDFDDRYTAPLNGFEGAYDYYRRASSKSFLPDIRVPTLLVNAGNDPFLGDTCYPLAIARDHPHVTLDAPDEGGHVGFPDADSDGLYWSERRAVAFLEDALDQ